MIHNRGRLFIRKGRMSDNILIRIFTLYLPLLTIFVFLLFPFYWTFVTSVKSQNEIFGATVTYWPNEFTANAYRKLFEEVNFLIPMFNSFIAAAGTTVVSLAVAILAAYAFSRFVFRGRKILMVLFLTNNMFPSVLLIMPLFVIMRRMGILHTPMSLILAYTTFTIPFSIWLLNGYLRDLPISLEEAAMIDGASRPQAFMRIVLPILTPCIVATGVYIFMTSWNEYTFAVIFTNFSSRTIPIALRNLVGQLGVQWDLITAGGIITIIPVCIMFFFAQRRLVSGLTAGAVKG